MKKFKYRNILYKIKYIIPNNVLITRTTITLLYFFLPKMLFKYYLL